MSESNQQQGESSTATSEQQQQPQQPGEKKIEIYLKNTGSAPVIKDKKTKWLVKTSTKVSEISKLVIKLLNLDPSQSVFIYVNQSFAPALDQTVQNLFNCYESDKKLILYYALTHAWG